MSSSDCLRRKCTGLFICALALALALLSVSIEAQESQQKAEFGTPVVINDVTVDGKTMTHEINGNKLTCNLYGKGSPVIVMISGFGAPQKYWAPILDDLANMTSVFTYDRPGYGQSEFHEDGQPIDGQKSADDLKALLENADIDPPYLILGHSMGCKIARLFCASNPDLVCGLILEDPGHEDVKKAHLAIMTEEERETVEKMESGMSQNLSGAMKYEYLATDITNEQLRQSAPLPNIPFVVVSSGVRRAPPIFSEETQKKWIEIGKQHVSKLAKLIPGGKHTVLEQAGHNIHLDDPAAFVGIIENVITAIDGKSTD
jgi:pimeloyl-ACP methyl ester carboxylesterase